MTDVISGLIVLVVALIFLSNLFEHYYISKLLSVVLLSFIIYALAHFTDFSTAFMISIIAVSAPIAYRMWKRGFRIDFEVEAVFILAFAFFLFLRSLVPDINGAEKFMDMAFLNSVLNAERFPPPDPYFASGMLNVYYYFGHVLSAVIVKLSMLPPEYGYNVAMAFFSAASVSAVYGLARDMDVGKFAVVVLIAGVPYSVYELLSTLSAGNLPGYLFYWNSTRIFSDSTFGHAITEFPYFSFIHADLHAHVIAIPLKILFIGILYRFYRENEYALAIPLMNFALFATNSWDAPAFFLLSSAFLIYKDRSYWPIVALSAILILIFRLEMNANAAIQLSTEFSSIAEFLLFWGFFVILLYARYYEAIRDKPVYLLIAALSPVFPPAIFFPILLYAAEKREFTDFLVMLSILTIAGCEVVVIDFRMNTYFKFYLLAWTLFLPAASEGLRVIYERRKSIAILIMALMLVYPAVATPVRHYKHEFSLDGLKFMRDSYPGDYYAVKFLYGKNAVVIEGVEGSYSYGGRIATFTGDQAVIAWPNHEVHWRNNGDELSERISDVRAVYTSSCSVSQEIARKYGARYIVYGDYERKLYGESNFSCMEKVFDEYGTEIYEVN
ncbi:DUF2298 domain-containing protein [Geoglobus acetivorans]|uniref:DUF2298 domain-containing protein n=1 Tax=Geoglobus acetivorans TaxID=565033 RepID=A0ABZ3H133_GEOAI|nr:hypothetical protein [Geoglobus acetivorans]